MIEKVAGLLFTPQGTQVAGAPGIAPVSDVERFNTALGTSPSAPQAVPEIAAVEPSTAVKPVDGPRNLGNAILDGLEAASRDVSQRWQAAAQAIEKPEIGVADLLRLQLNVVQGSLQWELVTKAIGKSAQNLEQIIKAQ